LATRFRFLNVIKPVMQKDRAGVRQATNSLTVHSAAGHSPEGLKHIHGFTGKGMEPRQGNELRNVQACIGWCYQACLQNHSRPCF
jgi:hypothetical protein